jgi:hypothetical protein
VEIVTRSVDRLHLAFSDLGAFGVEIALDVAAHLKICFGARRADEPDDDLMTDQRFPTPVRVMKANRRCSIHLLVPGGRWVTAIFRPAVWRDLAQFRYLEVVNPGSKQALLSVADSSRVPENPFERGILRAQQECFCGDYAAGRMQHRVDRHLLSA